MPKKSERDRVTLDPNKISVVAELERLAMGWTEAGDDEILTLCPFHADKSPSCSINTEKRVFKCRACAAKGDFVTFLARVLRVNRSAIVADLADRYGGSSDKPVSLESVERFHEAIWQSKTMLKELRKRAVSDESIRKYRLGFDAATGRITIPIPNEEGVIINVRKYLPGAPGKEKMRNLRGRGRTVLYPIDQLAFENIVICGGEVKSIAVAERLNPYGVGAVNATSGEENWDPILNRRFKGKNVWVCLDIDPTGIESTEKICAMVRRDANEVRAVHLPLDPEKYPKGDVNDFFGPEKRTVEEFIDILNDSQLWEPKNLRREEDSSIIQVALSEAIRSENIGKRVEIATVVRALDVTPYLVPSKVRCSCSRQEVCCAECPVFVQETDRNGFTALTISAESPGIIGMMASPKSQQQDSIKESLGIPAKCPSAEFIIDEFFSVEDARVSPHIDISARAVDREMIPAAIVGHSLELNSGYRMRGRIHPHPKNQQAIFLVSEFEPAEDALSTFRLSDAQLESLKVFRPKDWTAKDIEAKLAEIYLDLSANVTRIYDRVDLHCVLDLAFHSPLFIHFDGAERKGWVEVLILGDSSQGKSDTSIALHRHYGVGEKVDCKNATVAGLLGGLQSIGNRFFVSWGLIPTHDSRIVILEELKGASTEVISRLTDMRSSGIAEIPKIEKRRTRARTRLIALSNPRSGLPMASYNFGVEAVRELLGSSEDVRRFDAVCIVAADQIDPSVINTLQRHRPKVEHKYTSELCRSLVLWAWTSKAAQFDEAATDYILESASTLCNRFSEVIPIIDRGSFRFKLARLSAALAARTYSVRGGDVFVRRCHAEVIVRLLERMYSDRCFGYSDFSRAILETERMSDPKEVRRALFATPHPKDLISSMLNTEDIEMRDICDWCGFDRGDAASLLSLLVRKSALKRMNRGYRKSPDFISLLREMRDSKELAVLGQPKFSRASEEDDEV